MINDILSLASQAIPMDCITYRRFSNRVLNNVGIEVNHYFADIEIKANVQAVNNQTYLELGLDLQKTYVTCFAMFDVLDIGRNTSSDLFIFGGATYQVWSKVDWLVQAGFNEFLAVRID